MFKPHKSEVALDADRDRKIINEREKARTEHNQFNYEKRTDGNELITPIGRMRRFTRRKIEAAVFAVFDKLSTAVAFMISNDIADDLAALTKDSTQKINALFAASTATPLIIASADTTPNFSSDFITSTEFVTPDVADIIQQTVEHQINDIDLIARGKFMGPLREGMQSLTKDFYDGATNLDQFKKDALEIRGFIISEDGSNAAISSDLLQPLRKQFNCDSGSCSIYVFKEQAQEPTQKIIKLQWGVPEYGDGAFQPIPIPQ